MFNNTSCRNGSVSKGGILEEAYRTYTKNLVMVVPAVALVLAVSLAVFILVLSILPLGLIGTLAGRLSSIIPLLFGVPVLFLIALAVIVVASSLCLGTLASMAVEASRGGRADLGEAFEHSKARLSTLLPVGLVVSLLALFSSVIPLVGTATALTLFTPAFVLAILGASASEALEESVRIMLDALSRRPEVPVVVFVVYLLSSTWRLGLFVWMLGVPYAFTLVAYYLVNELRWSPRSSGGR